MNPTIPAPGALLSPGPEGSIAGTRVLVVDDELPLLSLLRRALGEQGCEVEVAATGPEAVQRYTSRPFDLVLLDLHLPGFTGIEVLARLRQLDPQVMVIIMTGYSSIESAVTAMKGGAADYLVKPLDLDFLEVTIQRALSRRRERGELHLLKEQLLGHQSFEGMVGVSAPMQRLYDLVRRLAGSDATVLIQGETGTGKELVARALHRLGNRRDQAFVAVNCGALPEGILESELFGHERGAFTGALKMKYGLFEQAAGGTLFLDEIEAMSPALQVKLLRAIQEREVMRVGGDRPIRVDLRLLAATNVDLRLRVEDERFRADLFYRLSVVTVDLPPLRARPGDVALLAAHFLRRSAERHGRPVQRFTPTALRRLEAYAWPGNVRELENAIEQALVLARGEEIDADGLPEHVAPLADPATTTPSPLLQPYYEARQQFERQYLIEALRQADGVVARAAQLAGIPRPYFYERMKRNGLAIQRFAEADGDPASLDPPSGQ